MTGRSRRGASTNVNGEEARRLLTDPSADTETILQRLVMEELTRRLGERFDEAWIEEVALHGDPDAPPPRGVLDARRSSSPGRDREEGP